MVSLVDKSNIIKMLEEIKYNITNITNEINLDDAIILEQIENNINKHAPTSNYKIPQEIKKLISIFKDQPRYLHLLVNTVFNPLIPEILKDEYIQNDSFISLQEDIENMDYVIVSEKAEQLDLEGLDYNLEQKEFLDTKINNIYRFMPLYDGGAFCYILVDLDEQYYGRLINFVSGYSYVLAPNLYEHINDLVDGISKGFYSIDAEYGDIHFPLSWYQRKLLKTGKYFYDPLLGKILNK